MPRRTTQICVAALLALCLGSGVSADTLVTGGNFVGANVWTPAGSPFIVVGDVTVPNGASLVIQAGVTVRVGSTDAQASGLDTGRVEIRVASGGTLQVQGTLATPVTFRAHTGSAANTWYGIVADAGATQVALEHASVEHAVQALRTSAASASLTNATFDNNGFDISVTPSSPSPSVTGTLSAGRILGNFTLSGGTLSLNRLAAVAQGNFAMAPASSALRFTLTSFASYETLAVTGTVTLGGALDLDAAGLVASVGDAFTLIDNDGADPVSSTFQGLAEGQEFDSGARRYRVSYVGGSGNDVTVTLVPAAPIPVFPFLAE